MHMADALLSPTVGTSFIAVSGSLVVYSAHRLARQPDERRVPLMGVFGAFVFAAQMINFTIPGTGSSGHLGGGMLLAMLLGPYAAFLVIASVLVVQSLFFLDGGVLALGTNIFNLGVWPCFLGLLIYRAVAGRRPHRWHGRLAREGSHGQDAHATPLRLWLATLVAVVASLELGALSVVLQTLLSRRSDLPFGRFAALMMGIHLPIALVEGAITATVVQYVWALRPTLFGAGQMHEQAAGSASARRETLVPVLISFLATTILLACVVAWFASPRPDGLEWSLAAVQEGRSATESSPLPLLERVQRKIALMPDYEFRRAADNESRGAGQTESGGESWPNVRVGTSLAGLLGAALTFVLICLVAAVLYWFRRHRGKSSA